LISEKTGEQVYFKIDNGTVYARSILTTRIKQVIVYNSSTGVLEHNEALDLYLPAGEWCPYRSHRKPWARELMAQ